MVNSALNAISSAVQFTWPYKLNLGHDAAHAQQCAVLTRIQYVLGYFGLI
jgi:hypothetical protein